MKQVYKTRPGNSHLLGKTNCIFEHHFADVGKMVDIGSGAQRRIDEFALTRYACYLIAQNGEKESPPKTGKNHAAPGRRKGG